MTSSEERLLPSISSSPRSVWRRARRGPGAVRELETGRRVHREPGEPPAPCDGSPNNCEDSHSSSATRLAKSAGRAAGGVLYAVEADQRTLSVHPRRATTGADEPTTTRREAIGLHPSTRSCRRGRVAFPPRPSRAQRRRRRARGASREWQRILTVRSAATVRPPRRSHAGVVIARQLAHEGSVVLGEASTSTRSGCVDECRARGTRAGPSTLLRGSGGGALLAAAPSSAVLRDRSAVRLGRAWWRR